MMKQLALCITVSFLLVFAVNNIRAAEGVNTTHSPIHKHISEVYDAIGAEGCTKPSFEVFDKAYRGYLNLQAAGKLNNDKAILTICDLSLSSNTNRMWIIDLNERKVLLNTYVAHGQGSGEEFAVKFSNKMNSHQSSLGFYVTGSTYMGEHGKSLYLHGMDKGFNHMAYERDIVVHGADYVSKDFICGNERLGRSWGCPAVPSKLSAKVIDYIKDSTCLFVYYPQKQYIQKSVWLNKAIDTLPDRFAGTFASKKQKAQPTIVYEYGPKMTAILKEVGKIKLPLF